MAGYKREPRVYKLVFEGEFDGLVVETTGMPVGEFLELASLYEKAETGGTEQVSAIFRIFERHLISWNLLDKNDRPIPATIEGLRSQELDFVLAVIGHWIEAISSVGASLGKASPSGAKSLEQSLPMDEPS